MLCATARDASGVGRDKKIISQVLTSSATEPQDLMPNFSDSCMRAAFWSKPYTSNRLTNAPARARPALPNPTTPIDSLIHSRHILSRN